MGCTAEQYVAFARSVEAAIEERTADEDPDL
jgi:hypothetical protein